MLYIRFALQFFFFFVLAIVLLCLFFFTVMQPFCMEPPRNSQCQGLRREYLVTSQRASHVFFLRRVRVACACWRCGLHALASTPTMSTARTAMTIAVQCHGHQHLDDARCWLQLFRCSRSDVHFARVSFGPLSSNFCVGPADFQIFTAFKMPGAFRTCWPHLLARVWLYRCCPPLFACALAG